MVKPKADPHFDLMHQACRLHASVPGKLTHRIRPRPPVPRAILASLLTIGLTATPAYAQNGERQQSVADTAGDAATQPLEDFNLMSREIPAKLLLARDAPYETEGLESCTSLQGEIMALDDVLGPDADAAADETGLMRGMLNAGGNLLSGFIPFRGIVRALSGANKKRAEMAAAVYAGVARRSYLKGYSAAKDCSASEASVVQPTGTDDVPEQPVNVQPFLVIAQGSAADVSE